MPPRNPTPTPTPYTRRIAGENGAMIGARSGVKSQNRQDAELFGSNMKEIGAGALDMLLQGGKLAGGALMMLPPALYGAYQDYTKPGQSHPIVNAIRSGGRVAGRVGGKMLADTWNDYTTGKKSIYYPEITIQSTKIGTPQNGSNRSVTKGMNGMCKCGSGMMKSMCKCGGMGKSMTKRASIRKGRFTNAARTLFGHMGTAARGIGSAMGSLRGHSRSAIDELGRVARDAAESEIGAAKWHGRDGIVGTIRTGKGRGIVLKPGTLARMTALTEGSPSLGKVPVTAMPYDPTNVYQPATLSGALSRWATRREFGEAYGKHGKGVIALAQRVQKPAAELAETERMIAYHLDRRDRLQRELGAMAPELDTFEANKKALDAQQEAALINNAGRINRNIKTAKKVGLILGGLGLAGAGIAGGMALANRGEPSGSTSPRQQGGAYGMNGSGRASMMGATRTPSRQLLFNGKTARAMSKSLYKGPLPPTNMNSSSSMSMGNSNGMGSMGMNNSGGMGMGGGMSYKRMSKSITSMQRNGTRHMVGGLRNGNMSKRATPTKAQSPSNKYL